MRRLLPIVIALALPLACTSKDRRQGADAPRPREARATLLFVSDLWGQLEPCGCAADMKGGVDRMAGYVASLRAAGPVLLVDTGDALFDATTYAADEEVQARLRAKTAAAALVEMGLDAKVLHERDRVLEKEGGWFPSDVVLAGPALREVGGVRVGLLPVDGAGDLDARAKEAAKLREQGADLVVALAHVPRQQASSLQIPGVDLVVGGHIDSIPEGDAELALQGPAPILYPLARGQGLVRVEVVIRDRGGPFQWAGTEEARQAELAAIDDRIRSYHARIAHLPADSDAGPFLEKVAELQARRQALAEEPLEARTEGNTLAYRLVSVTQDFPSDTSVRALLDGYDREVAEANLAYAKANPKPCPEPAEGEASYVGQAACAACHPAAQAFWVTTAHGNAYATLEEVHKQYDLSCVSCHVTGWEQPGGACNVAQVEGRKDVGCESCHGPGSAHAQAPSKDNIRTSVQEATCKSCHRPEHSLDFDYATYLQRVLGPGHGKEAR